MKNYEITNIHEAIVKELLNNLNRGGVNQIISYSDLCAKLGNTVGCREIASYLGDISCWSKEIGAPMLSAMVVNKATYRPGNGFFNLYSDLYGIPLETIDKDKVFVEELNKVLRYRKWDKLKYYMGI